LLENVSIEYLNCNSGAFADGDEVIVEFEDQDFNNPKVIGFAENPQGCGSDFIQIGGQLNTKNAYIYYNDTEAWSTARSLPATRNWVMTSCAPVLLKIYIMGGQNFIGGDYDGLDECAEFDTELETSAGIADMLSGKMLIGAFAISLNVYVCGGLRKWVAGYGPIKDFEKYDTLLDSWQSKSDLSVGRWSPCAASVLGKGYLFYGRDELHGSATPSFENSMKRYDPGPSSWSDETDSDYGRCYAFAMVLAEKIYAVVGVASSSQTPSDTEVFDAGYGGIYKTFGCSKYDPVAKSWSVINHYPYDGNGNIWGKSGAGSKGRGYQIGNKAVTGYFASLNPETDTWAELDPNPNDLENNWIGAASI
jgi:hypothetical protein